MYKYIIILSSRLTENTNFIHDNRWFYKQVLQIVKCNSLQFKMTSSAKTEKSSESNKDDAESLIPTKRTARSLVIGVVFALALFCVWSKHKQLNVAERKR